MKNRDTGEGKGFAFVAFKAKEVAQQAIEELHNKEFKVFLCLQQYDLFLHTLFFAKIKCLGPQTHLFSFLFLLFIGKIKMGMVIPMNSQYCFSL